uniref:pyrroline-5-carboxylate reductase n=1 Tax=Lepeophtheirus salmonis TaxID=72036 RepID=A0A0K2V3T0_LEPSM
MYTDYNIGFIGAGKMALALATGLSHHINPDQIYAFSPSGKTFCSWKAIGARCSTDPSSLAVCNILVIAVKPHMFDVAIRPFTGWNKPLFVSVMAGLSIKHISSVVSSNRIVRIMTNTASAFGCACSVYAPGEKIGAGDDSTIQWFLNCVGSCEIISESNINGFTALAGSGPAYIYTILEGLADGGVLVGLSRAEATKFAAQMTMGAAKVALESGKHTGQLKDDVTSPAGTTMSGIQVLEKGGIRGVLIDAVQASANRAAELSGQGKNL